MENKNFLTDLKILANAEASQDVEIEIEIKRGQENGK